MNHRIEISKSKRWVVKIGTSLLTGKNGSGINANAMETLCQQIVYLRNKKIEVCLVSSGSIGAGMVRLGWCDRPKSLNLLQAAAAVGQMALIEQYEHIFRKHELLTAQVLLTHEDFAHRKRYLNARSTILTLLDLNIIPIINENDTVVNDEISFGDNDTLGALVTNLVEANILVLLTDQEGLYDSNPLDSPNAKLISQGRASDDSLKKYAQGAGEWGRGGMVTKLIAAQTASKSGAYTLIASGNKKDVLKKIKCHQQIGTLLLPDKSIMSAKKQWLAGHLRGKGALTLDCGAVRAIQKEKKSLLSVGVLSVNGNFQRGDLVLCLDQEGKEIARGISNYNSKEINLVLKKTSQEIFETLGYTGDSEIIHRNHMVVGIIDESSYESS